MLLRHLGVPRVSSLQTFSDYRRTETGRLGDQDGPLVEYETLELRLNPPQVEVDNSMYDDMTVITIDSANRPGTLVEVVMCITELGLSIRRARISSDGGWFVDDFYVTETPKGKVTDARKVSAIKTMLDVDAQQNPKELKVSQTSCTVFELSGLDHTGLLAAVVLLLAANGCELLTAAVWTFHDRVALVVGVRDLAGCAISDAAKLQRLQQTLLNILGQGEAVVKYELVHGDVHHERRLHHLLLLEEKSSWTKDRKQLAETSRLFQAGERDALSAQDNLETSNLSIKLDSLALNQSGPGSADSLASPSPLHQLGTNLAPAGPEAQGLGSIPAAQGLPTRMAFVLLRDCGVDGKATISEPIPKIASTEVEENGVLLTLGIEDVPSSLLSPDPDVSFSRLSSTPLCPPMDLPRNSYMDNQGQAEVQIRHSVYLNYWLVTIQCKDRNKLFFDTICTLTDMQYDVFHGTIDSEGDTASQMFYVRPRYGECVWDDDNADMLKYMLESAVLRRFPKGFSLRLRTEDQGSMCEILQTIGRSGFSINRAEVLTVGNSVSHTLSLTDEDGKVPPHTAVQRALEAAGGLLVADVDAPSNARQSQKVSFTFNFSTNPRSQAK